MMIEMTLPTPDRDGFARLKSKFEQFMPDFQGFEAPDGTYAREERRYKDELVAAYRRLILPLLDAPAQSGAAIHEAMIHLLGKEKLPSADNKVQNLIWYLTTGTLGRLEGEAAARSGDLVRDLLRGPGDVYERLDRFCPKYLEIRRSAKAGGGQAEVRSIASILLMLDDPNKFIFVRISTFNEVYMRLFGCKLLGFGAIPGGTEYRQILDFAAVVRDLLTDTGWPPQDMIDVQGFIWVAGGGYDSKSNGTVPEPHDDERSISAGNEPSFPEIELQLREKGFHIEPRLLRRYRASLAGRGFVILAGPSGSGKTWLTKLYAEAIGARHQLCSVAPNWVGPEDLLGYHNPINNSFAQTSFTSFLNAASEEYDNAIAANRKPLIHHLVLDEMNLARVEYYFATFLSAMEVRAQSPDQCATIDLCPGQVVRLTPNLNFIGTVNIDETTHDFSDKVYDRAQLVEMDVPRLLIERHIGDVQYAPTLLTVWDAVLPVAPFAYRVIDEIAAYMTAAKDCGASWQEALDEQLLQKVLPKLRGNTPDLKPALATLAEACQDMPLSRARIAAMNQRFVIDGFVSFF